MTDEGRNSRDPEVRPSKFGAGYTVGGPPAAATPPPPAPGAQASGPPPPPVSGTQVSGAPPPPPPVSGTQATVAPPPPPPVSGTQVSGAPPPPAPTPPPPPLPTGAQQAAPPRTGAMPTIAVRPTGPATGAIQTVSPPRPQILHAPTATTVADADVGTNVLARISLALVVIFGAFISPVTLATAFIARGQIKRSGQLGADLAVAALVVSAFFLGIGVISVALLKFGAV
jgi:hypothetical protein